MFGAKYSRLTFWIWSVILIIPLYNSAKYAMFYRLS